MSGRGSKRRQVLQMGNASKLHRYGYSKEFHAKKKKERNAVSSLIGDFSDTDSDDNGDIEGQVTGDDISQQDIISSGSQITSGDSTFDFSDRLENPVILEKPSDMDDEFKNFLSEIEAIPIPTNDIELETPASDPDTCSNDESETTLEVAQKPVSSSRSITNHYPMFVKEQEEEVTQKPLPETKSVNSRYSMFVKGESEFVHSPKTAENNHMEPKEEDFPEEPVTDWHMVQDETTQYYYYWNVVTNEVTWEIPSDYTQFLLLHREYEEKIAKYTPEQREKLREQQAKIAVLKDSESKHLISEAGQEKESLETSTLTSNVAIHGPEKSSQKTIQHTSVREVSPSKCLSPQPEIGLESKHHKHKKEKRSHHKKRHKRKHEDQESEEDKSAHKKSDITKAQTAMQVPSAVVVSGCKLPSIVPYLTDDDDDDSDNSETANLPAAFVTSVVEPIKLEASSGPKVSPVSSLLDNASLDNDQLTLAVSSETKDKELLASLLVFQHPPPPPPPEDEDLTKVQTTEDISDNKKISIQIDDDEKLNELYHDRHEHYSESKQSTSEQEISGFVALGNHNVAVQFDDKEVNEMINAIVDPSIGASQTESEADSVINTNHILDIAETQAVQHNIVKEVIDMFDEHYLPLSQPEDKNGAVVNKGHTDSNIDVNEVTVAVEETPLELVEDGEIIEEYIHKEEKTSHKEVLLKTEKNLQEELVHKVKHNSFDNGVLVHKEKEKSSHKEVLKSKDEVNYSERLLQGIPEKTRRECGNHVAVKSVNIVGYASDDEEEEGEVREKVVKKDEKQTSHKEKRKKERKKESNKHRKITETDLSLFVESNLDRAEGNSTPAQVPCQINAEVTNEGKPEVAAKKNDKRKKQREKDVPFIVDYKLDSKDVIVPVQSSQVTVNIVGQIIPEVENRKHEKERRHNKKKTVTSLSISEKNKLKKEDVNSTTHAQSNEENVDINGQYKLVEVVVKKSVKKQEADDAVELDFDVDDIDRALEVALENKMKKSKVELETRISNKENSYKDGLGPVAESNNDGSTQGLSDEAICQTQNLDNNETIVDKNKTKKALEDGVNQTEVDMDKCLAEIKEMSNLALSKLEFLDISTDGLSRLQVLLIELQTRHTDWVAGGLSTQYFYDQLKIAEGLLEQYELSAVPDGWACQWDRINNRYYYRNTVSNSIQWEYPGGQVKEEDDEPQVIAVDDKDDDESTEKVRSRGSDEHRRSRGSGRSRKKDEKEKSKRDKRVSSRHYHRKRKRDRDQSNSSNSSADSEQYRRHRKSKKKRKRRVERSPSIEIVEDLDGSDVVEIEAVPAIPSQPESPLLPTNLDLPSTSVQPDIGVTEEKLDQDPDDELQNSQDDLPGQSPLMEESERAMLINPEIDGEELATEPVEEPVLEIVNPAVISKPPQILIQPPTIAGINYDAYPSEIYPNVPNIASVPVAFYQSYGVTPQLTTDQVQPSAETFTEASEPALETDKTTKKKKKDKKSLTTGSSILMKKKHMSSMVQKWQKVKIEVEKEDRAKELRQAAIRKKIEELKSSDKPS